MESLLIFLALILGVLFPQGHVLTFLIRPFLMVMLFYAFLSVPFNLRVLHRQHAWIAIVSIILPLLLYVGFLPLDYTLALAAFITGMAPTAAVAPVITALLKGRVEFVTVSVLFTTPMMALVVPVILPWLMPLDQRVEIGDVFLPVAGTVFIPLLLGWTVRYGLPGLLPFFKRTGRLPFFLFLSNVYTAGAQASNFIRYESDSSWQTLVLLAVLASVVGVALIIVGQYIVGKRAFAIESALALGRKNTMFSLWVALTYINPVVALGPIFYIGFQNIYNTAQLLWWGKRG